MSEVAEALTVRRYTDAVDRGLSYVIADLQISVTETRNRLHHEAESMPRDQVKADRAFVEDCQAAIEWLRYQRAKRGEA